MSDVLTVFLWLAWGLLAIAWVFDLVHVLQRWWRSKHEPSAATQVSVTPAQEKKE